MKTQIAEMTFLEFEERKADNPVIILPFGSVEIQGPRSPMGDYLVTQALVREAGEQSGALVAPCTPFGVAEAFRCVAGGVQLRAATLQLVVRDVVEAFLDHGLNRLLIVNGHTGNHAAINDAIREVRRTHGIIVPWINIWSMLPRQLLEEAFGANAPRASGHGASVMGSLYEHYYPEIYRRDVAPFPEVARTFLGLPTNDLASVKFGEIDVFVPINLRDHCEQVVKGDATLATAEAGRTIASFIVKTINGMVSHLESNNCVTSACR